MDWEQQHYPQRNQKLFLFAPLLMVLQGYLVHSFARCPPFGKACLRWLAESSTHFTGSSIHFSDHFPYYVQHHVCYINVIWSLVDLIFSMYSLKAQSSLNLWQKLQAYIEAFSIIYLFIYLINKCQVLIFLKKSGAQPRRKLNKHVSLSCEFWGLISSSP